MNRRFLSYSLGGAFALASLLVAFQNFGSPVGRNPSSVADYFKSNFKVTLANVYWGDYHTHSNFSADAALDVPGETTLNAEQAIVYARDTMKLDFFATSDHAEAPADQNRIDPNTDLWTTSLNLAKTYSNNDPAKGKVFAVFPAFEYTNGLYPYDNEGGTQSSTGYGHKNVLFFDPSHAVLTRLGAWVNPSRQPQVTPTQISSDSAALWSDLEQARVSQGAEQSRWALTVVHTPASLHENDWEAQDGQYQRNVEIYSSWGNSEGDSPSSCRARDVAYDHNPIKIATLVKAKSIRNQLQVKWIENGDTRYLMSFTGGSDDHAGLATGEDGLAGVTGVIAPTLSREGIWDALYQRRTIAAISSGTKRYPLLMAVEADGEHAAGGAHLQKNPTKIRVRALGAPEIQKLDVIVDGCLTVSVPGYELDRTLSMPSGPRHYVYVRAALSVGEKQYRIWSSPVYLGL